MPRHKQQRPRHIVETIEENGGTLEHRNMCRSNDHHLDDESYSSSSPKSSEAQEINDLNQENICDDLLPPPPPLRRDDATLPVTPSPGNEDSASETVDYDFNINSATSHGLDKNGQDALENDNKNTTEINNTSTLFTPFMDFHKMNMHSDDTNSSEIRSSPDYLNYLRNFILKTMHNDSKVGKDAFSNDLHTQSLGTETAFRGHIENSQHLRAMWQNTINPFQLMAKLIIESHNKVQPETRKQENDVKVIPSKFIGNGPSVTKVPPTLAAIRNHILNKNSFPEKFCASTNRVETNESHKHISNPPSTCSDISLRDDPTDFDNTLCVSKSSQPVEKSLNQSKENNEKIDEDGNAIESDKKLKDQNIPYEYPLMSTLPWRNMTPGIESVSTYSAISQNSRRSSTSTVRCHTIEDDAIKKEQTTSSTKASDFAKRSHMLSENQPDRYDIRKEVSNSSISAMPKWSSIQHNLPTAGFYNISENYPGKTASADFSRFFRQPELSSIPSSYSLRIPHGPLSEFPNLPQAALYNPWSMMYPPLYPHLDPMISNPFLEAVHPNLPMSFGNPHIPNRRSGASPLSPSRPSSDPSFHHLSGNRKLASRAKTNSNNPIDSLHAAIVREAKEMNKGMDPENMYIECPICHKKIKRLYHFQRHMRIHSGDKSHTCPFCPYKSVRKDNLKSHMKTHEKSKYESSKRTPTRRDSATRPPTFPTRSDYRPTSNPSFSSGLRSPSNSVSSTSSGNSAHLFAFQKRHPTADSITPITGDVPRYTLNAPTRDMPLLSPKFTENFGPHAMGLPYNGYPSFPQVLRFRPHSETNNGTMQPSPASIIEIEDQKDQSTSIQDEPLRTEVNCGDTIEKEQNASIVKHTVSQSDQMSKFSQDSEQILRKRPADLEFRDEPKRHKIESSGHPDTEEDLLLANANNSNNFELNPLKVFTSSGIKESVVKHTKISDENCFRSKDMLRRHIESQNMSKSEENRTNDGDSKTAKVGVKELVNEIGYDIPDDDTERRIRNPHIPINGQIKDFEKTRQFYHLAGMFGFPCVDSTVTNADKKRVDCVVTECSTSPKASEELTTEKYQKSDADRDSNDLPKLEEKNIYQLDKANSPSKLGDSGRNTKHLSNYENKQLREVNEKKPPMPITQSTGMIIPHALNLFSNIRNGQETLKDNTRFQYNTQQQPSSWLNATRESKCRLCNFVANNNTTLQEHMSTHKEDGMYRCQQCDYHGKNLSKLIEHIRIHTGERPFQCDQCSYAAKRKDNLAQHKSVRHDKNRFKGPARVLKLSGSRQKEDSINIHGQVNDVQQRKPEYRSIFMSTAGIKSEKRRSDDINFSSEPSSPPMTCNGSLNNVDRVISPAANGSRFIARNGDKDIGELSPNSSSFNNSTDLFNMYNYPAQSQLNYGRMTSSFMYGHPLMTSSVFSSIPASLSLGNEAVGAHIMPFSPHFPDSTATNSRVMNGNSHLPPGGSTFSKTLHECAR